MKLFNLQKNKALKISRVLVLICIFLAPALLFSQPKKIVVSGNVKFNDSRTKMEIYRTDGPEKIIIAEFDIDADNNFKQEITVTEPGMYYIDCKKWERIGFWAEDENVSVNFRGMDTAKMKIKNPPFHIINGGPKNEVINHLNFITFRNYQMMIAVSQATYKASFATDLDKEKTTSALYDANSVDTKDRIKFLAELYSDRTSVVALLGYLSPEKDKALLDKISSNIYSKYPNYAPLQKFLRDKEVAANNAKRVALGSPAPAFEYPTKDGKMFGPQSFKGKILLIDFWASWCGPCRSEIPNLKDAYAKYNGKGVEFLSVSIDKGSPEWIKAMTEENMPWTQILATNAGKEITSLYQFSGIPFIILIDQDGKIVAKNLRGANLLNTIDELLNKKR